MRRRDGHLGRMAEHDTGTSVWPEFVQAWERFLEESSEAGTTVLVEGERDRDALRRLGVKGPIALVHRGQSLSELSHDLARHHRRVIVLTDWDLEGGQIAHRLEKFLANDSAAFDLDFRRRLAILLRGELTHVEGLFGWARRTAEKAGAPLDHFVSASDERP